jgi:glycosyltransferase 2 family protein
LWPAVRIAAVVAALVALVAHLGAGAVLDGLRAIDTTAVVAALGIGLLTTVAGAWRWSLVARGLGLRLPLRRAVADSYLSQFLNSVLPAGVLGDVHRAVDHGRRSGDLGRGVRAVMLERLAGQVVLVLVAVAVLLPRPALIAANVRTWTIGAATIALVVAGAAVWARHGGRAPRLRAALCTGLRDARAGLRHWPAVVALSVVAVAGFLALFVVAARTAGVAVPLADLLPLLVFALLAMAVPLSVGGFGPREAATTVAFGAVGIGATQGLTTAVVYGVLSLVGCLPGLAVLIWRATHREAPTAELAVLELEAQCAGTGDSPCGCGGLTVRNRGTRRAVAGDSPCGCGGLAGWDGVEVRRAC